MIFAKHVVLKSRPDGAVSPENFGLKTSRLRELVDGEFLIQNSFLSLDAGFRQWMNAGASDNYLSEMPLEAPVQSIVLGKVIDSKNSSYPVGCHVVGRTAWETHSIADGSDLMTIIEPLPGIPLEEYLAALGPSGMTAYFGLLDIGKPQPGNILLVSAAAGGVGSLVGQLGKIAGCTTIGISSSDSKCEWLKSSLGYDQVINYRDQGGLEAGLNAVAPNGVDIYFDNVGGRMLDNALCHLRHNARVVLCGAISQYETDAAEGVYNLWQLVTKRARAEGFMFSDYVEQYSTAIEELAMWIREGKLCSPLNISEGIESTGSAFCDMLCGINRGKSLVRLNQSDLRQLP
jgi:NADPH-dependent curcumin reductase